MYSPAPAPSPANIGLYWTDEEIFMSLERMTKGSAIPENVTTDVNPYQHKPSSLPDDIWYLIRSEQGKNSEHGSWSAIEGPREIFRNSAITGWRTTLEYHEGQAPHGQRTNWLMQEYWITYKGLDSNGNSKESALLCRVFLSSPKQEMHRQLGVVKNSGTTHLHPRPSVVLVPELGSTTGRGFTSEPQARDRVDYMGPLAANGGHQNIAIEDMLDFDYISSGDFLELDDLADRESRSSSLDNSSCLALSSEDCFDSVALLQELEDPINQEEQGKHDNCKFSVAASVRSTEVVMRAANLGSLVSSNGSESSAEDINKKSLDSKAPKNAIKKSLDIKEPKNAIESQKEENRNEGTSNSCDVATSSSSHRAVPEGEKEDRVRSMRKPRKEYLRFMPF